MTYSAALPHIDNILWLRQLSRPFPKAAGAILNTAQIWNFSDSTINFLKQYPRDEVFDSEDDFLTRCEELMLMIREERSMPMESLRSPQD